MSDGTEVVPSTAHYWLLIDHDNVHFDRFGLLDLLNVWITTNDGYHSPGIIPVTVRAYGGWYREDLTSEARYRASEFYQETCPSVVFRCDRYFRLNFEFAENLIVPSESSITPPRITHTVVLRPAAQDVSIQQTAPPCGETGCQISVMRRWIRRRRACTRPGCPHPFSAQFTRTEQKQVDVHLAVDFITVARQMRAGDQIAIISDDADLLPAIASAAVSTCLADQISLIRCTAITFYLDNYLTKLGVRILRASEPGEAR
jgi:uncharacterized LabA/DUF88 family protein